MRKSWAYDFSTSMTLAEVLVTLKQVSSWPWIERHNDRWDYISAGVLPKPEFGIVKIVRTDGRFNINIRVLTDSHESTQRNYEAIDAEVRDKILPSIGAQQVTPAESWER